jgi:hypothetical protein
VSSYAGLPEDHRLRPADASRSQLGGRCLMNRLNLDLSDSATRQTVPYDEATDYALFDDSENSMECDFDRPPCRGRVTWQDWRRPDLQEQVSRVLLVVPRETVPALSIDRMTGIRTVSREVFRRTRSKELQHVDPGR